MKKAKVKKQGGKAAEDVEAARGGGSGVLSDTVGSAKGEPASKRGTETTPASSPETSEDIDPIEELQAKVEKLEDGLLRAKAEYQNAQRRHAIEQAGSVRYANAEVMKSLLGVLDDFDRSLAAAENSDNLAAVVDGVRLVYGNLTKALRDHGLELIAALHEPFDPRVHEAVMQQTSADFPPGTVVQEVAKGYRLRDRVLRPSKVIVSKEPCHNRQDDPDAAAQADGGSKQNQGKSEQD